MKKKSQKKNWKKQFSTKFTIKQEYILPLSIFVSAVILSGTWVYSANVKFQKEMSPADSYSQALADVKALEEEVLPSDGIVLPVVWGDLGAQMIEAGVIDADKFEEIYSARGGLDDETKALLFENSNKKLKITPQNSTVILNLLWALGLGTKNDILETGPMNNPIYGGAGNFASTGGWTLGEGDAMSHYSQHSFIVLTDQQQELVERVSKNIYRPCCGNSTHFPDCNHGMAMLGLLELMASGGVAEGQMYKTALQVNAYWFPDTYLNIARYFGEKGIEWKNVDPKEILGYNFSSISGYRNILSEITPIQRSGGQGCGV